MQIDAVVASAGSADREAGDRLYRKIAWRLIPFLMICYVGAYLDRVNVGFAKLQMLNDLQFSETIYGLGAGIFFIGYFLFEVPSNLMLQRVGARIWIARIMITWGIISACFAFVSTPLQFYILRFLLGAAEAGFYPGVILYLTYWIPSHRRSQMIALFMTAIPIAGIVGGPLSGWIMQYFDGHQALAGWKWLFLFEAIPSIVLGIATIFCLTDRPEKARWLSEQEKAIVVSALDAQAQNSESTLTTMGEAFRNPRMLLMCMIYFCVIMGQYGLTFWMPTLVKSAGVTGVLQIGLFSAIPYTFAVVVMISAGRNSDRTRERRWHVIVPMLAGALGYMIVAAAGGNVTLALIGLSLAAAGAITPGPLFWALPSAFLAGTAAAAGIAAINAFAGLAGFVSPYLIGYLRDITGTSTIAMYTSAAVLVLGALAILKVPAKLVNR
ncbi:D-galactonate transporter [Bradyrhizobium ottawaense]|uniref:MFS transporter n=1 Tax=Bradyrhizobium ottawaense TaxID=931866 RepID=UPI003836614B